MGLVNFDLDTTESFQEINVRKAFIRKVLLIVMLMFLFSVGMVCLFVFTPPIRKYMQENFWVLWTALCIQLFVYFLLMCITVLRRTSPWNIIFLVILTLAQSVMLAHLACLKGARLPLLYALTITVVLCGALICFALQTKWDFTTCGGCIIVLSIALLALGIACIFVRNRILHLVYASLGILVFGIYLVFDVQMLMIGKRQNYLDPEDYIAGAISIYTDMIMIFMYLLNIMDTVT